MTVFPALYSVLSNDALITHVLSNYVLEQPITCRLWQQGGNDTYLVIAGATRWILRITIRGGSVAEHEQDAELLLALAACGVPIGTPVQRRDGGYVQELAALEGPRFATLFRFAEGEPPGKAITAAQAYAYGQAVARMHSCFDTLHGYRDRWRFDLVEMLEKPLSIWSCVLVHRAEDLTFLRAVASQLSQSIMSLLGEEAIVFGLCHGDVHKTNLLVTNDGALTIIDFDGPLSWRAYDVAVLRWSLRDLPQAAEAYRAYLNGYTSLRGLSENERAAIPSFVAARHIYIYAGEMTSAINGYRATQWINDAYFDEFFDFLKRWMNEYCRM